MIDLALCYVPKRDHNSPPLALGLLKAIVEQEGYKCKVIDFNYKYYANNETIILDNWIDEIIALNPKWVGLSAMSTKSGKMTLMFIRSLKNRAPNIKIMVGGSYLTIPKQKYMTSRDHILNLADVCVIGEGEVGILEAFNTDQKIIEGKQPDLNSLPFADYSDLNMSNYKTIDIISSKGCVNQCRYCDLNFNAKYRVRDGELTAKEILYNKEKYGINSFLFADNLINGSIKEYRKLFNILSGKGLELEGQLFCDKRLTNDDFKLAKDAGISLVNIGLESGSERIRKEMGKSFFSNSDFLKMLGYMRNHGIPAKIQIIIGWPSETENDFKETLDIIQEIAKYRDIIDRVKGNPMLVTDHMRVFNDFDFDYENYIDWSVGDNNVQVRVNRYFRLKDHCKDLNLEFDEFNKDRLLGELKKHVQI